MLETLPTIRPVVNVYNNLNFHDLNIHYKHGAEKDLESPATDSSQAFDWSLTYIKPTYGAKRGGHRACALSATSGRPAFAAALHKADAREMQCDRKLSASTHQMSEINYTTLNRSGQSGPGATKVHRISSDFLVDGQSLLGILDQASSSKSDLMGCFVQGFPKENSEATERLCLRASPDTNSGRVTIYVCPECGDIGCGAYSVRVSRDGVDFIWSDFAYENGYEDARAIAGVGPYLFAALRYESVVDSLRPI